MLQDDFSLKNKRKNYLLNIRSLPPIPTVVVQLTQILNDPMTSTHQIGNLISQDQALTTKILTVANSPLYGLPRKVPSIDFAILVLGFEQIKQIVIALSLMDTFKNENSKYWNRKSFWMHSFLTAMMAKNIAAEKKYPKTNEAFTAGLLHDLGISVIQKYFNREFVEINELVSTNFIPYSEAELAILDLTHAEIGKILCDKWNLPVSLSDSILYHHNPSQAEENKKLAAIVHLADYTTQQLGFGKFLWDEEFTLDTSVIDILELGGLDYVESLMENYGDQLKQQLESVSF
ncbi:MAG: histidine kinase [Ignavibacteriae bacterium HGW-Ignavibacteriae-2]|nr:HDOD domain-containing protein [Bacteroidota bacterium]PKL89306.1 MAG: histidine kinase [Ignavibacteriae bacterium HGW-Ignavibacteriae-2]